MDQRVVAYHEAGHAVVAWCLGIRVRRASIIPDDDSVGHILPGMLARNTLNDIEFANRFTAGRLQAEKRAMVSIAGELAQRRFSPRSVRSYHGRSDRRNATLFLAQYAPCGQDGITDARTHYKLLREWTNETLEHNWHLVKGVAEALMQRYTLSGKEVREVILEAQDQRDAALMRESGRSEAEIQQQLDGYKALREHLKTITMKRAGKNGSS